MNYTIKLDDRQEPAIEASEMEVGEFALIVSDDNNSGRFNNQVVARSYSGYFLLNNLQKTWSGDIAPVFKVKILKNTSIKIVIGE